MDKYHIFHEIGAGRQSLVFKGRRKKTTNYVAIKRVEKGLMEKVVNEVAIMHSLSHPHTLKFYDWYETRNNLWLILEYCSGGDLKTLLKADKQLPIAAVKLFGGDLLAGLQYLHYGGVLYCDLKPSNVLLDEHGVLKLAGFGLARRVPTVSNKAKAPKNRGTPFYMSPELFVRDGVHNFASDLWSFGVLCYELATGRTPFQQSNLSDLMECVLRGPPDFSDGLFLANAPAASRRSAFAAQRPRSSSDSSSSKSSSPFPTTDFVRALSQLLRKDATQRPTWADLRKPGTFWHDVIPPPPSDRDLPAQPLFEAYLRQIADNNRHHRPSSEQQPQQHAPPPPPPPSSSSSAIVSFAP